MDDGGVVRAMFTIEIAEMERRLGIVRVDTQRLPPGLARSGGIGAMEDLAQKIPSRNERGSGLEQRAQQRFRGRGAARNEGKLLCLLQQRIRVERTRCLRLQPAVAVLVALAAAAGAACVARRGRSDGGGGHKRLPLPQGQRSVREGDGSMGFRIRRGAARGDFPTRRAAGHRAPG